MIQSEANGRLSGGTQAIERVKPKDIKSILSSDSMRSALKMALPKHVTADRVARVALTALSKTPKLALCTQESFFGSLLSAAQLGLEVNTPLGHAYLIPYKSTCTLIIGYQGMIDLANRAGVDVYGNVVRESDDFEYELGLTPKLVHKPSMDPNREDRPVTHVYAVGIPKSGRSQFVVLSRAEVEKYRKRSMSKNDGPWVTDWDAMALKTAVRRLFRWLPKSIELQQAITIDEAHERNAQRETYDTSVLDAMGSLQLEAGAPEETETEQPAQREPGQEG